MARSAWLAAELCLGAAPCSAATTLLRVYFSAEAHAAGQARPELDCTSVVALKRQVPRTTAVADAALRQLFAGPTEAERAQGYRSPFSGATAGLLKRVFIEHGTAYVDLHDLRAQLGDATSSCGAAEFQTQLERTLRQFPTVRRGIVAIEGEPRRFYEWIGQACDLTNDRCDAAPFVPRR